MTVGDGCRAEASRARRGDRRRVGDAPALRGFFLRLVWPDLAWLPGLCFCWLCAAGGRISGARAFSRSCLPSASTNLEYSTSQKSPLEWLTHMAVAHASLNPASEERTSTRSPDEKVPVSKRLDAADFDDMTN